MREATYLIVSNLTRARTARNVISDMLPGPRWGMTESEHKELLRVLSNITARLEKAVDK